MPVNAGAATPASATKVRTRRRVERSTTDHIRHAIAALAAISGAARSAPPSEKGRPHTIAVAMPKQTPVSVHQRSLSPDPPSATTTAGTKMGTKSVVHVFA